MKGSADAPLPGDVVAARIKEVRRHRGWTQEQLSARLDELGYAIGRGTLAKIETVGSTRALNVSVADVLAISAALNVAPLFLVCPNDDPGWMRITPNEVVESGRARQWWRGLWPLAEGDSRADYFRERPESEVVALEEERQRQESDEIARHLGEVERTLRALAKERGMSVSDFLKEKFHPNAEEDKRREETS
jgi:transcriptional regulator with XRE-family HTH domain